MGEIRIERVNAAWKDRTRDYRIMVDGVEVAKLSNGASATIAVQPGIRLVQAKTDWCNSPELEIHVGSSEAVLLECGPNSPTFLELL